MFQLVLDITAGAATGLSSRRASSEIRAKFRLGELSSQDEHEVGSYFGYEAVALAYYFRG